MVSVKKVREVQPTLFLAIIVFISVFLFLHRQKILSKQKQKEEDEAVSHHFHPLGAHSLCGK